MYSQIHQRYIHSDLLRINSGGILARVGIFPYLCYPNQNKCTMYKRPTNGQFSQIKQAVGEDITISACVIVSEGNGKDSEDGTYFTGSFIVMVEGSLYRFHSDRTYHMMRR